MRRAAPCLSDDRPEPRATGRRAAIDRLKLILTALERKIRARPEGDNRGDRRKQTRTPGRMATVAPGANQTASNYCRRLQPPHAAVE